MAGIARNLLCLTLFLAFVTTAFSGKYFDRVFTIVFENTHLDKALTDPNFAALAKKGTLLTDFWAVTHPSQPNYIAMLAGEIKIKDNKVYNYGNYDTLVDLLERKGVSWKAYQEMYPGNCNNVEYVGTNGYARRHNPFMSFTQITKNAARCAKIVNSDQLDRDVDADKLPQYSFYTPTNTNNGHSPSNITYAGKYLTKRMTALLNNPKFTRNTLIVVTFDEGVGTKNNVYTLLLGPYVKQNVKHGNKYTHWSLMRTIEDNFGLGTLGREDAKATPLSPSLFGAADNEPVSPGTSPTSAPSQPTEGPAKPSQTFIAKGSSWKYTSKNPNSAPSGWPETDTTSWSSGNAPFGFGDSVYYGTKVTQNGGGYYFSKTFTVTKAPTRPVQLQTQCDNGCDVYIGKTKVLTDSANNHEYSIKINTVVSASLLTVGTHTVRVYVKNLASSTDLYMDLHLIEVAPTVKSGSEADDSAEDNSAKDYWAQSEDLPDDICEGCSESDEATPTDAPTSTDSPVKPPIPDEVKPTAGATTPAAVVAGFIIVMMTVLFVMM